MEPPPLLSLPVHGRWTLGFLALFAGTITVTIAWAFALALLHSTAAAALASVIAFAGVAWVVVRAWRERVEVHADHLVHHAGGRSVRWSYDQIARIDLQWFDARRAYEPQQPLT